MGADDEDVQDPPGCRSENSIVGAPETAAQIRDVKRGSVYVNSQVFVAAADTHLLDPAEVDGRAKSLTHNLPARPDLIGRDREVDRIFDGFRSHEPVITIQGLGGSGKTTLALHAAWSFAEPAAPVAGREELPAFSSVVWLEDSDGRLRLSDLLDVIAYVVGMNHIPPLPLPIKTAQIRRYLQATSSLLVIDNYETISDPEVDLFMSTVPGPSKVLLTTRGEPWPDSWIVRIAGLDRKAALQLIQREKRRIQLEGPFSEAAAGSLVRVTDGNPLAIRMAVSNIQATGVSLPDYVHSLQDEGHEIFEALFDMVWRNQVSRDPAAKSVMLTACLFSSSASSQALEAGSGVRGPQLRAAIKRLTSLCLLDVVVAKRGNPARFGTHPLARTFFRLKLEQSPRVRDEITKALVGYYVRETQESSEILCNRRNLQKLRTEEENILYFADTAYQLARSGDDSCWPAVIAFADTMSFYLWGRGRWDVRLRLNLNAVAAAVESNDHAALARQWALAGRVHLAQGDRATARDFLGRSLAAARTGEMVDRLALRLRAQIATDEGNYAVAQEVLLELLREAPNTPDEEGRAATLVELGIISQRSGELAVARQRFLEALRLDSEVGATEGQAICLQHLGETALLAKDLRAARNDFRRSVGLARKVRRRDVLARSQLGFAEAAFEAEDIAAAYANALSAARAFDMLGISELGTRARGLADRCLPPGSPAG